ncbi:dapper homolog 1 isoform X2 [Kryptolebias marmoratus]|uniref:dapper homolog 1 isoform X2 n=1 Tax=Kryptolebias marmoratus TaxID=37003 RepID=UPI0007F8B104|nr:dapper homolog 1 isoform X2 [Kryptolebias marmoratus]
MPQSEPSRRDRAPDRLDPERPCSARDRLDLIGLVLGELDFLRQRQELLVRTALQEEEEVQEAQLDSEENILVLRLRRRDAALITQLQQLDQQIHELRLDTEASHDQPEADSRPSSGFFELSDGTSGSLSNSSHSVFSEGLCAAADSEGPLPLKEKPDGCLDRDVVIGGLCGDSSSSPSAARQFSLLVPNDFQSKSFSGQLVQTISETHRFPGPLHAVAVQDPGCLQTRDETSTEPQSSFLQTYSNKHLDSYIYSLLQRRAQPIRTSRPRTSFSTDPSKGILRQASLCGRQVSGPGCGLGTTRPSFLSGGTSAESGPASSSQRQSEEQNVSPGDTDMIRTGLRASSTVSSSPGGCHTQNTGSVSIKDNNTKRAKGPSAATLLTDFRNQGSPSANSSHKITLTDGELLPKSSLMIRTQIGSPRNGPQLLQSGPAKNTEKSVPQLSSKSLTGGRREGPRSHMGNGWYLPARQQNLKDHRGNTSKMALRAQLASEANELPSEKTGDKSHHKSNSRTILFLEEGGSAHIKASHRGSSSRNKSILDKHTKSSSLRSGGSKPHHHRVSSQPKHKRKDHRRLHVIAEVPSDRGTKRQRHLKPPSAGQQSSPYSYVTGSDSEYSAECLSLFHSTIVDTSEDERSNYTTNCFGDSESSEEESVEENSTATDQEESVGGGPVVRGSGRGRGRRQSGAKQDSHPGPTKTSVKIKASHNLKKKILRSRSGSLKLMTTV